MNFKEVLLGKEPNCNLHWLDRYLRLCGLTSNDAKVYRESHHVLPKWAFPEHDKAEWNLVSLPVRVHILAHYCLMRAWPHYKNALSVIRTTNQVHAKGESEVRFKRTKAYSIAREVSSKSRKGTSRNFVVTEEYRNKMSSIKKALYADPNARETHSNACKGISRSEEGKNNIKEARKGVFDRNPGLKSILSERAKAQAARMSEEERARRSEIAKRVNANNRHNCRYIYVTPFGHFTTETPSALVSKSGRSCYLSFCLRADEPIHYTATGKNKLFKSEHKGRTPRSFGFYVIPFEEYSGSDESLNQVHPPEPNHELRSELGDFLSRYDVHL